MNYKIVYLLILALFLSLVFPLSSITAQPQEEKNSEKIEEYLSLGKNLYRQDKFQEAKETWQKVLEIDPNNNQAQRYIDRANERLQELKPPPVPEPAEKAGLEAAEQTPVSPPLKMSLEIKPLITPSAELVPTKEKPARFLTLKQSIQTAVDNNPSLRTAKREVKLAKQKVKDAWRALFPAASIKWEEITGTTTGEDFKGREFYLELQQPIYQGGRLVNTLNQAQLNLKVARSNYQKTKNDLVYEVEQAYHILASTKKTYRELTELIGLAKQDLSTAEKEYQLELAREIDFLNVKNLYQETEYKLLSTQKDLTLAYLTLYQTLNIDHKQETIDIPEPPMPKILEIESDKCLKLALENRPDLDIKKILFKFNKYGLKIAESGNSLKIDLTASGGYKDEAFISESLDLKPEWYVGVRGSIPVWLNTLEDSFIAQDKVPSAGQTTSTQFKSNTLSMRLFDNTTYTSITEARVNLDRAKDELQKIEKSVRFEVKQDFYEYEKAVYQLSSSSTKLRLNEVELAIISAQRDLNLATTNDLLRSRIKLWEAKTGYHQATAGYFTSVAKINKTIGISEYFNPMEEISPEAVYSSIPPPILDISLVKQDIPSAGIEKTAVEQPVEKKVDIKKQESEKQRLAQEKEQKKLEEQKQRDEEKQLAQLKKKAEQEEKRKKEEEARRLREEEKQKLAKEKEQKQIEEKKQKDEEKRLAELKRQEEKKKKEGAEKLRQEEKQRLAQEKEKKKLEEAMREEQEKIIARMKKEDEEKRLLREKQMAQLKKEEEKKKHEAEKQRLAEKKEQKRLEEQKGKDEEKRLAELKRQEEKKKKEEAEKLRQEEKQRLAQEKEKKKLEEAMRKEQEKIIARMKKEDEEKRLLREKQLAQLKKEEEEKKTAEKRKAKVIETKQDVSQDEYARAELLAKEIAEQKAKEKAHEKEQKRLEEQKQRDEEKRKKEEEARRLHEAEAKRRQAQLAQEEEEKRRKKEKETEKPKDGAIQVKSIPPAETKPDEYESAVIQAKKRLTELENEKVKLLLRMEEEKNKEKIQISQYIIQGKTYYEKKDYNQAIKEWSKALVLEPDNTEIKELIKKAEEGLKKRLP